MTSGIYGIYCNANHRWYIGQAKNITSRFRYHEWQLKTGKHFNRHLQSAWSKYGPYAFDYAIIEFCEADASLLCERETFWIAEFDAVGSGFNICPAGGSCLGVKHGSEMRARMSAVQKVVQNLPETRARMSATQKARQASREVREKMSATAKAVHARPETKAKTLAAAKARFSTEQGRATLAAASKASQRPDANARRAAAQKARLSSHEARAKLSAVRNRPDVKARQAAAVRAAWARKKLIVTKSTTVVQLEMFREIDHGD